jgi:GxxExxY protein
LLFRAAMTEKSDSTLLHFDLSQIVIGAFFDTFNELGGGFPEKVVSRALAIAIREKGLTVVQEMELPVWFRGRSIAIFQADLVVENKLIVEVKTAPEIQEFHRVQLLHYLKATDIEVGLIVNFGREPKFRRQVYENSRKLRHYPEPSGEELQFAFRADEAKQNS